MSNNRNAHKKILSTNTDESLISEKLLSIKKIISTIERESCAQVELEDFIVAVKGSSKVKNDIGGAALRFFISQLRIHSPRMYSMAHISTRPVKKGDIESVFLKAMPKMLSLIKIDSSRIKKHSILNDFHNNKAISSQRKWNQNVLPDNSMLNVKTNRMRGISSSSRIRIKKSEMIGLHYENIGNQNSKKTLRSNDRKDTRKRLVKNKLHMNLEEDNPYL